MAMLLPSVFPRDIIGPTAGLSRPLQLPFLDTSASHYSTSRVASADIQASCRALQVILGIDAPSHSSSARPPRPSFIQRNDPFEPQRLRVTTGAESTSATRPNKRSRLDFEQDDESHLHKAHSQSSRLDGYQTPKRQCKIPDEIPRGLMASDFETLETPALATATGTLIAPITQLPATPVQISIPTVLDSLSSPKTNTIKRRRPNMSTRLNTDSSVFSSVTGRPAAQQTSNQSQRPQTFVSDQPVLASFLRSGRCRVWPGASRQSWPPLTRRTTIA